ncbi:type VI secretion system Vgr family protein [Eudoraea adriatica]|uniref:type VI secretion system Vgr family protein n=1 Tax=Eudoraea adriatica TaxID=446681 RepID=UPI0003794D90|nr:phage baseplate assembly protein V [Eudoraea adriatica]
MTLSFKTTILLDSKEIPIIKELHLYQKVHAHHTLEARVPLSVFKDSDSHQFLGKAFSVEILTNNTLNETVGRLEFKGIVTAINMLKGSSILGNELVIIASSKDIVSNEGPHYNCFHENSLDDIVKKALHGYDFDLTVDSYYKSIIDYTVQHHESAYEFVKRLAEKYGEWFYYNGKKVIFGKPEFKTTPLKYNYDLSEFKLSYIPQPQKFNYFTQNYLKKSAKSFHYSETGKPKGVSGDNSKVFDKSNTIFKNETNVWVNGNNETNTEKVLKAQAKVQQSSFAVNQVRISGKSWNSAVALGNIIEINDQKYRIIEVVHSLNGVEDYENSFEAVNANIEGYPYTNINSFPVSQSQIAIVKENNDPDKLGRIKVAFAWQELIGQTTPWIRVLSAHAGENQGIQFIPEIEDQVIVDFEGGDAESPYVIGALYHTSHKPDDDWISDSNNIKAIRTRSGHTIELDDTQGAEKISIYTKNDECKIELDTKEKTLSISAMESIDISASKISIKAGENITIAAENKIEAIAKGELAMQSQADTTIKSGKNLQLEATANATLKGLKTVVKGDTEAELSAAKTKVSGSGMTEVSGGLLKLN